MEREREREKGEMERGGWKEKEEKGEERRIGDLEFESVPTPVLPGSFSWQDYR